MPDARLAIALLAAPVLAGCLGGLDDPAARASEGPLVLEAAADRSVIAPGETVAVEARLSNQGLAAPEVRDACENALALELVGPDGESVQRRPAVASCAAYATSRLWPGQDVREPLRWNGTTYDREEGYRPAPAGEYTVQVRARTASGDDGDGRQLGPIEVPVEVDPGRS